MAFGKPGVRYDDSDERAMLPLSVEELDRLLADRMKDFKSTEKVLHLARRVKVTLESQRELVKRQNSEMAELRSRNSGAGAGNSSSINPREALKFIPARDIAAAIDSYYVKMVDRVEQVLAEVKALRSKASAEATMLRAVRLAILEDPELPKSVKDRLLEASDNSLMDEVNEPELPEVPKKANTPVYEPEPSMDTVETYPEPEEGLDDIFGDFEDNGR